MIFTIRITGWTSQVQGNPLPLCEISSPVEIKKLGMDFDAYSSKTLVVHTKNGQYVSSFIFWQEARVHADIGDIHVLMVNLDDKIGILFYSKILDFSIITMKGENNVDDAFFAEDKNNVWNGFGVLEDGEKIVVRVGDKT